MFVSMSMSVSVFGFVAVVFGFGFAHAAVDAYRRSAIDVGAGIRLDDLRGTGGVRIAGDGADEQLKEGSRCWDWGCERSG